MYPKSNELVSAWAIFEHIADTYGECEECARREAEAARFKMNTTITITTDGKVTHATMSKRMWSRFGRLLNNSSFSNYGQVDEYDLMRHNYDGVKAIEVNLTVGVSAKEAADILANKSEAINYNF